MPRFAEEIMTPSPATVHPASTLVEVLHKFDELGIRHLPVIDGGDYIGMVTETEVRRALYPKPLEGGGKGKPITTKVREIMRTDITPARHNMPIETVVDLLLSSGAGGAPVLDDDDILIGIICHVDIIKAVRTLFDT